MASSSVIGALRVVLGADTASLETGLKKAQSSLSSFGAAAIKSGAVLAGALAGAAAGIGVAVKHTIDRADALSKTSQKIGIPTDQLSALQHAADLSGLSLEGLTNGIGKLSKAMTEAAAKPTGEAALAFQSLGISVTDANGKLKSSTDVMNEVADKFAGIKDGAGKTAVSMLLFGKTGKDLIPLLNSGSDGIKEMTDEARRLGIVIDSQTGKSAEAFNDNLTRLGKVKDAIILKITQGMIPSLERMSNAMVAAANDTSGLNVIGEVTGSIMEGMVLEIAKFSLALQRLPKELSAVGALLKSLLAGSLSDIKARWADLNAVTEESDRQLKALVETSYKLPPITLKQIATTVGLTNAQKDYNFSVLGSNNALEQYIKSQKQAITAQEAEIASIGKLPGTLEATRVVMQGLQKAEEEHIKVTPELTARLQALGNQAGAVALKLDGMRLIQENLDPVKAYQQEMNNTTAAMTAAGASSEELARAQEKIRDKFGESSAAIGSAIANIAGSFSSLLGSVAKDNKALGIASKAFGIAQVIINTQIAITKALATLGPIGGPIAAAVFAAQGAASIATIAAQGFARGGSFKVGGSGGTDSKLVQFMATPGEMVDVKTPGQQMDRRSGTTEITLRARRLTDMLTLDDLRDLIDSLNSANRDGYKLKVAT